VADCVTDSPISLVDLKELKVPAGTERLLLRTRTSALTRYKDPWAFLDLEAASWLVDSGCKLVGIDTPSIAAPDSSGIEVHRLLLDHGIAVVEGLRMEHVTPGEYELICLPMRILSDGAPVRAILRSV
jgi:arylformamidase